MTFFPKIVPSLKFLIYMYRVPRTAWAQGLASLLWRVDECVFTQIETDRFIVMPGAYEYKTQCWSLTGIGPTGYYPMSPPSTGNTIYLPMSVFPTLDGQFPWPHQALPGIMVDTTRALDGGSYVPPALR